MASINIKVEHAHHIHRFTLLRTSGKPHYPSFAQLCEALIHHLKLRATVSQLLSHHPPIHVWYLDGEGNVRLRNNSSVREALRKTPRTLRLRLRYRRSRSSKSDTSTATHPPSRTTDTVDEPYQPSPTTLLRLLNHAENHASERTQEALEELRQAMLKYPGDAANLAAARHRLARLYCSFLRRLANTPVDKVRKTLEAPLWTRLEAIMEDEDVSDGTIRAARRAVRIICSDRQALIHMRTRWAVIVSRSGRVAPPRTAPPSSKGKSSDGERPIKHYQNHVQKLVQAGGGDVVETYRRLMKYSDKHDAFDKAKPGISRELCRSVEKIVFHVVRCHKKEGRFVVQSHAARALAASVGRKFERAGFDKRFVSRTSNVTRAMVDDPAVVELVHGWAKKRSEREASATDGDSGEVGRLADEDDDELFGGRRDVDESDSTTTTTTSTSSISDDDDDRGSRRSRSASRRSRSASRRSRSASRRSRSASRRSSRSASRTGSKKSRSASGSRGGSRSRGRSRSASRVAEEEASRRSRSRSRSRSRKSGRSESRASLRSLEEDADELLRSHSNRDKIAVEDSSESSSEDRVKIYQYGNHDSDDESDLSNDTSRSQWARVQMEKEKEKLRRMYRKDRGLFGDHDGSAQVDISKRLRHARDSMAGRSLRDVPNPSEGGNSVLTDEPVRRVGSMRSGRSPRGRRKSKSPFRKNLLWFREVGPREGVVS